MTYPCGHTRDQHSRHAARRLGERRQAVLDVIGEGIDSDPSGWADALGLYADIITSHVATGTPPDGVTERAAAFGDDAITNAAFLTIWGAAALEADPTSILVTCAERGVPAVAAIVLAGCAQGVDDDTRHDLLAMLLATLPPDQRAALAHLGAGMLNGLGVEALALDRLADRARAATSPN